MSQGRVSANPAAAATLVALLCLMAGARYAEAVTYDVGDADGWYFNVLTWPNGKSFKAGDVLVFKYDAEFHNLAVVDEAGYTSCKASAGSKLYTSGNDRITLTKGKQYFICAKFGHCEQGMKIAVDAA